MDELHHCLRIYVVIVSVLVAVVGTCQWRRWRSFKTENQLAWLALVALNAATGYGTVEVLLMGQPGGTRNLIVCLAETWLLAAVLYHPLKTWRERRRDRPALPDA